MQPQVLSKPRFLIYISAVFSLFRAFWRVASSQAQSKTQAPPPPTVEVTEVSQQDTPIYSEYPAQTYARSLVEVRGRVDGYIEKWLFRPVSR